jgi:DNA-binding transcriptional LysR family regulator
VQIRNEETAVLAVHLSSLAVWPGHGAVRVALASKPLDTHQDTMKDLDLTTLRLFVEVCDAQSIKRVAEREQVDASAITKRMAKLEEQLQAPLLKRVRQGVVSTPEGALFCEQARRLVTEAQRISESAIHRNGRPNGSVTIASNLSSMSSVLTDDLGSFMLLNSRQESQLIVKEMVSKDVVHAVREGRASIGVVWDNTETTGLQHVLYYHDRLAAVMKSDHPLAHRAELTYEELRNHAFIADKHTLHTQALLQRTGGIKGADARFAMQVESSHTAVRLAAQGVGIYVCQTKFGQLQDKNWNLAIVPLKEKWALMRTKLLYKSNLLNPLAKALIEHLAHQHPHNKPEPA